MRSVLAVGGGSDVSGAEGDRDRTRTWIIALQSLQQTRGARLGISVTCGDGWRGMQGMRQHGKGSRSGDSHRMQSPLMELAIWGPADPDTLL